MNPLPSSSRVPNFRDYNITKILGKKTYVPNLSASRMPKVKGEENSEEKKDEASPSTERRRPFREKKLLQGTETFAPAQKKSLNSRITIKSRPKSTHSPANSTHSTANSAHSTANSAHSTANSFSEIIKKELIDRDGSQEVPIKSYVGKFAAISSALPQDLPVDVPRPRLSPSNEKIKPHELLMDLFDPTGDESPMFILKTPKYLPRVVDNATNSKAHSSKSEEKHEVEKCTIHDIPEGHIGTLQIMKSGKLRLVLGECKFWLHRGVRVNFREELAFVDTVAASKTGEIVNLGDIKDRIVAVPESVTVLTTKADNPR